MCGMKVLPKPTSLVQPKLVSEQVVQFAQHSMLTHLHLLLICSIQTATASQTLLAGVARAAKLIARQRCSQWGLVYLQQHMQHKHK